MNGVGYLLAAYVGAGVLYGAYAAWLRRRERSLTRNDGGAEDRG